MEKNSLIKLATNQMRDNYNELLLVLSEPVSHSSTASASNNMSIVNSIWQESRSSLVSNFLSMNTNNSENNSHCNNSTLELSTHTILSVSRIYRKYSNFLYYQSLTRDCKG